MGTWAHLGHLTATTYFLIREHHDKAVTDDKRRKSEFASIMEGRGSGPAQQQATSEDLQCFASEEDVGRCGKMQVGVAFKDV